MIAGKEGNEIFADETQYWRPTEIKLGIGGSFATSFPYLEL